MKNRVIFNIDINTLSPKKIKLGRLLKFFLNQTQQTMFRKASNWESIVEAVKNLADFYKETQRFDIPYLALKIGFSVMKCA